MLSYYYIEEKDRLYVYDYETGFYKAFDKRGQEWYTPFLSFSVIEHDFDLVEISEAAAKELSNGVSFEEQYKAFLKLIGKL